MKTWKCVFVVNVLVPQCSECSSASVWHNNTHYKNTFPSLQVLCHSVAQEHSLQCGTRTLITKTHFRVFKSCAAVWHRTTHYSEAQEHSLQKHISKSSSPVPQCGTRTLTTVWHKNTHYKKTFPSLQVLAQELVPQCGTRTLSL